jgi:uncharacterized protein
MVQINPDFPEPPKFIADKTLGKLVRYLRFAGFDTALTLKHEELIVRAERESRILLTRNRSVVVECRDRQDIQMVFHGSDHVRDQFIDLNRQYNLWIWYSLPCRCMTCNGTLTAIDREDAEGIVPDYVLSDIPRFYRCGGCQKVIWRGSHATQLRDSISTWMDVAHHAP